MLVKLTPPTLVGNHLKPHTAYAASIATMSDAGEGQNVGLGDQPSDEHGHVVFTLDPALYAALARTGRPCTVTMWIRDGGSGFDAPPAHGTSALSFQVA